MCSATYKTHFSLKFRNISEIGSVIGRVSNTYMETLYLKDHRNVKERLILCKKNC